MCNSLIKYIFMFILATFFFLTGCATIHTSQKAESSQIIGVNEKLTVHLYDSLPALRAAYMYQGGNATKINRVLGFYSEKNNSLHCVKWDFYTCGHELYHALQYKGSPTLSADRGYEHFDEINYTREKNQ